MINQWFVKLLSRSVVILLVLSIAEKAFSAEIPGCKGDDGENLSLMNETVLEWKTSKPNQFKERALIEGTFVRVTTDRTSHFQFNIQVGPDPITDLVEVVYNKEFGEMPEPYVGMRVSACGDFINAFASSAGYPASPAGAIIHWVHMNPGDRNASHPDGYVVMDGELVGHDHSSSDHPIRSERTRGELSPHGIVASATH